MNSQRDHLSDALRELAAASPQSPAPELGERLHTAFQRHHRRRRMKRAAIATGMGACLLIATAALWMNKSERPKTSARDSQPAVQQSEQPPAQQIVSAPESAKKTEPVHAVEHSKPPLTAKKKQAPQVRRNAPTPVLEAGDFVALPTYDPNIPPGLSRMVRMDLPGPALQLMGYPVDGQLLNRRVLTDVLVGQDGLPYAVRLVSTSN